jgi:hypothetical protein
MTVMKNLLCMFLIAALLSCRNGNKKAAAIADSSNIITDSSALKGTDTTGVIGENNMKTRD